MPFELARAGATDSAHLRYPTATLTAAVGDCLAANRATNVVVLATAASTVLTIEAIAQEAITASSAGIDAIPILGDESQLWIAETANATAADQLLERMVLTDANTVNNTGADSATATGVFKALAVVGLAADNRMLGHFIKSNQVTA